MYLICYPGHLTLEIYYMESIAFIMTVLFHRIKNTEHLGRSFFAVSHKKKKKKVWNGGALRQPAICLRVSLGSQIQQLRLG